MNRFVQGAVLSSDDGVLFDKEVAVGSNAPKKSNNEKPLLAGSLHEALQRAKDAKEEEQRERNRNRVSCCFSMFLGCCFCFIDFAVTCSEAPKPLDDDEIKFLEEVEAGRRRVEDQQKRVEDQELKKFQVCIFMISLPTISPCFRPSFLFNQQAVASRVVAVAKPPPSFRPFGAASSSTSSSASTTSSATSPSFALPSLPSSSLSLSSLGNSKAKLPFVLKPKGTHPPASSSSLSASSSAFSSFSSSSAALSSLPSSFSSSKRGPSLKQQQLQQHDRDNRWEEDDEDEDFKEHRQAQEERYKRLSQQIEHREKQLQLQLKHLQASVDEHDEQRDEMEEESQEHASSLLAEGPEEEPEDSKLTRELRQQNSLSAVMKQHRIEDSSIPASSTADAAFPSSGSSGAFEKKRVAQNKDSVPSSASPPSIPASSSSSSASALSASLVARPSRFPASPPHSSSQSSSSSSQSSSSRAIGSASHGDHQSSVDRQSRVSHPPPPSHRPAISVAMEEDEGTSASGEGRSEGVQPPAFKKIKRNPAYETAAVPASALAAATSSSLSFSSSSSSLSSASPSAAAFSSPSFSSGTVTSLSATLFGSSLPPPTSGQAFSPSFFVLLPFLLLFQSFPNQDSL